MKLTEDNTDSYVMQHHNQSYLQCLFTNQLTKNKKIFFGILYEASKNDERIFHHDFEIKIKKKSDRLKSRKHTILDHTRSDVPNGLRGPIRSHHTTYFLSIWE